MTAMVLEFPTSFSGRTSSYLDLDGARAAGNAFRDRVEFLSADEQKRALRQRIAAMADLFPEAHAWLYGETRAA